MKTNVVLGFLISALALSVTACAGDANRTAVDPSAAEIAAHRGEDPTMPKKEVDLKLATAYADTQAQR